MLYINYQEYLNIDGVCDSTAFNRNIDRVCGIIDSATYNRIESMSEIPAQVKALCRDLVEYLVRNVATDAIISSKSQSAGQVSESESYVIKTKEDMSHDIKSMIHDYLISVKDDNGTPLLYRGCNC